MNIGSIFGISEQALQIASKRADLLANNLANASTPNYKARDLDFQAALDSAMQPGASENSNNSSSQLDPFDSALRYRIPMQAALDGNTVDPDVERTKFMENSMQYQVNLSFVKSTTARLQKALQGE